MARFDNATKAQSERNRILILVAIAMIVSAAIGYGVASFGESTPTTSKTSPTSTSTHAVAAGLSDAQPVLFDGAFMTGQFETISGEDLWASYEKERYIYRSNDGGTHWFAITPSNVSSATTIKGSAILGTKNLWFGVERGDTTNSTVTVDHSSDGGQSWMSGKLSDCAYDSCQVTLSFVTPSRGWALVVPTSRSHPDLYMTTDGGKLWKTVAATPFSDAIDFSSNSTGWATNVSATTATLYQSTDSGHSWVTKTLPLAANTRAVWLGTPHFFSALDGVVPSVLSNGDVVVFVTNNGGRSWDSEFDPVAGLEDVHSAWYDPPLFNAVSLTLWTAALTMTNNGGRTWSTLMTPTMYDGGEPLVWGFAMTSSRVGWLDAFTEACAPDSRTRPCGDGPWLSRTTDGGRTWQTLKSPTR